MWHRQTKRNFHTYKSCYLSVDNMSETTGFRPYSRNFCFAWFFDFLLHLQDKPTHFITTKKSWVSKYVYKRRADFRFGAIFVGDTRSVCRWHVIFSAHFCYITDLFELIYHHKECYAVVLVMLNVYYLKLRERHENCLTKTCLSSALYPTAANRWKQRTHEQFVWSLVAFVK